MKLSSEAVIALGANLNVGDDVPVVTLRKALGSLGASGLVIRKVSRFYATPCFPEGMGPEYDNSRACIETDRDPSDLLEVLHAEETEFGRGRTQRWGMRTLDLDLVCFNDCVLPNRAEYDRWRNLPAEAQSRLAHELLVLPQPRVTDCAFVLMPMAEVAADWQDPVLNLRVAQMIGNLRQVGVDAITPI